MVGVVVGGGGGVTGVVGTAAGVGAGVGVGALEPDVVDVAGCVVVAPGTVVGVAAAPVVAEAGMPLFKTANHTPPTFCPCACPFFLSPSKR